MFDGPPENISARPAYEPTKAVNIIEEPPPEAVHLFATAIAVMSLLQSQTRCGQDLATTDSGDRDLLKAQVLDLERKRALELAKYFASASIAPGLNPPSLQAPRLPPDATLVALSQLGALKLDCNRSFISLIDQNHQYIISEATKTNSLFVPGQHAPSDGIYLGFSALELSFGVCPQTIEIFTAADRTVDTPNITANKSRYVVRDFCADPRFSSRPYVTGWPHMRSYAEVPLTSASGFVIGSYCVVDDKPRAFGDEAISVLEEVASTIMNHLDLLKTKLEHDRVERLVRGLGAYVNGTTKPEAPQTPPFPELLGLNPPEPEQHVSIDSRPPRAILNRADPSTNSVSSQSSILSPLKTFDPPSPAPESYHESIPRQDSPGHGSWPPTNAHSTQSSIVAESVRETFARAGDIIRQSMDMQSVVILEPSSHDFGGIGAARSRSHDERQASVSESMFASRTCDMLAYSTEMGNSLDCAAPTVDRPCISYGLLQRMLLRYPVGLVVSADEHGVLSSPRTPRGFAHENGFVQYDVGSRATAEAPSEADDAAELFRSLQHVRSVVFLPIWNFQQDCWFSVIIGWSTDPARIFDVGDLDYLSAFGNSIVAEVARIEALALSGAKSDFISSISHELRSPLHGILAGTELLRDSMTQTSESGLLDSIDACSNMLLDTMNHLLDYAKINNLTNKARAGSNAQPIDGSIEVLKRAPIVNLGELFQDVVDGGVLGHSARLMPVDEATVPDPGSGVDEVVVLVDIDPSVHWSFETDVGAWKRIVMNIFGNSLKYTNRGRIEVKLFLIDKLDETQPGIEPKKHICVQVSDTGRGMSADYLRHGLFKPFVQENNLSAGAGLGLSIVQRLVESLNGKIEIQSSPGVGTRFDVLIPIGEKTQLAYSESSINRSLGGVSLDPEGVLRGRTLCLPALLAENQSEDSSEQSITASQGSDPAIRTLLASVAQGWLQMKVVESTQADCINCGGSADVFTLLPTSKPDGSPGSAWTLRIPLLSRNGITNHEDVDRITVCAEKILLSPFGPRKVARALLDPPDTQTVPTPEVSSPNSGIAPRPTKRRALANREVVTPSMPKDSLTDSLEDPCAEPIELDTNGIANRGSQATMSIAKQGRQQHVLLVDDNSINLKILSKVVQDAGCSFVAASDGSQAVKAFTTTVTPFDLIFMDLSMPIMDGCTATRLIRAHESSMPEPLRRTQIVALTALGSAASKDEAFASGIDVFLSKPVPMKEVKALVAQNLG